MKRQTVLLMVGLLTAVISAPLFAQGGPGGGQGRGPGFGRGQRMGRGMDRGMQRGMQMRGHDERHAADHQVLQFLLKHHDKITRSVEELPNGVETWTESDHPDVAKLIKDHVKWMKYRIEKTNPIRMRDPLFAELFQHADKIELKHEETEKGVHVIETSDDPYVVRLIQAHAKVVSQFVERGFAEAMKSHAAPSEDRGAKLERTFPAIAGHGAVVRLPAAAMQPRDGTKLLVDVTHGNEPAKLNDAIEKVAKFVNLYTGGGAEPADAHIAVVFHGDATLDVLNPDAYTAKFGTKDNPNLPLLHQLHEAGVEFYVCGQSLISKGARPEEVAVFVETAVSALTAVVNLQSDGYAYLPLN